jgi:hypothetical protein
MFWEDYAYLARVAVAIRCRYLPYVGYTEKTAGKIVVQDFYIEEMILFS